MIKQELLEHLKDVMQKEEGVTPAYWKQIQSIVNECALSEENLAEVKKIIEMLRGYNSDHRERLKVLFDKINKEKFDVF